MAWEEQKKEIETIKKRTFQLELFDADVKRIFDTAGRVSLSPEELLENFIGDLVDGTYSNGSDERMLANEWFERCGFSFTPEHTFLKYLIDDYRVDELLENVNDLKTYEREIADYQEGIKNGWIKGRHGLPFAWNYDRGLPDGETAYDSRAEWEQDLKDDLKELKEEASWRQKDIKELWQEYLDDRRTNDEDHGTMEEEIEKVRQWGERRRAVLEAGDKTKPSVEHKAAKELPEGWTWEKVKRENGNRQERGMLSSPDGISYYAYERTGNAESGCEYWIGGIKQPVRHYQGQITDEEAERQVLDILEKQTEQENTSALEECMKHTASKSAQRQEQGKER